MIFRWLYRRQVVGAFGQFLSPVAIDKVMTELTEFACFKLLLPMPIRRFLLTPAMTERAALLELQRMASEALAEARDLPSPNSLPDSN